MTQVREREAKKGKARSGVSVATLRYRGKPSYERSVLQLLSTRQKSNSESITFCNHWLIKISPFRVCNSKLRHAYRDQ